MDRVIVDRREVEMRLDAQRVSRTLKTLDSQTTLLEPEKLKPSSLHLAPRGLRRLGARSRSLCWFRGGRSGRSLSVLAGRRRRI